MKLGDCLTLINGRAYKRSELLEEGTPVIRIQNLNGGENWYYSDLQLPEEKYCSKGDLLFAWSATFGPFIWDGDKGIYHYHIWKVIPKEKYLDRNYAYYMFQSITAKIKSAAHGSSMPHYGKGFMEKLEVNLPPIDEQRKIASILDRSNRIKQGIEQSLSVRNEFLSSVFLDIFGDSTIENRYQRTTIGDNSLTVSKGTTPMTHGMDFVSEGIPFLRVQDLVKNPIDPLFAAKAIDQATHDFLSRSQLKPNDILISIAGTIGRISIISKDSPEMNCNQAVAFVRLAETSVLRHFYLMHWLNSRDARLQMAGSSVTATISNLSLGKIKDLKVPMPPLNLQLQFEKICERFDMISTHNGQINGLVDSITQEMLT